MQTTSPAFDLVDFLSKVTGPIVAAIAAAILATWFATNRFYKEKWWEKRLVSFTEIIEISFRIKMMDDYFLECQYYGRGDAKRGFAPHPEDISQKLVAEYWADLQEIERITQLSEFTLTPKTSEILNAFLKERERIRKDFYDDAMQPEECQEDDYKASNKLLRDLVSEAKRSLKIKH
ncbi:hypothetical protein [Rahnella variigena]|uniref:hypothetical protein n=1 Tax=Rahnella variigena TaxID=574964 RepID=UPI00133026F1|nr:hypothetical protein [Rahnella variigena]